jgi:hypothetical protein
MAIDRSGIYQLVVNSIVHQVLMHKADDRQLTIPEIILVRQFYMKQNTNAGTTLIYPGSSSD